MFIDVIFSIHIMFHFLNGQNNLTVVFSTMSDTYQCAWLKIFKLFITWHLCELATFTVAPEGALARVWELWPNCKLHPVQTRIESVYSAFSVFLKTL